MSASCYFSVGKGPTTDSLDFLASPYTLEWLDIPRPQPGQDRITVQAGLTVAGATATEMWDGIGAIETKLNQARYGAQPYGDVVTLGGALDPVQPNVYFIVEDGQFPIPAAATSAPELGVSVMQGLVLSLTCLALAEGDEIVDSAVTITGGAPTTHRGLIPGTAPARVNWVITDNSTGSQAANALRIATYSPQRALAAGSFRGTVEAAPAGSGASVSDATASGGSYTRLAATAKTWTTLAGASNPTPALDQSGKFDIYARVRSSADLFGSASPTLTAAVGGTGGASLIQSAANQGGPTTSLTTTFAGNPANGNLLTAVIVGSQNLISTIGLPAGWTQRVLQAGGATRVWIYSKLAGASEPASVAVTFTANTYAQVILMEFAGVTSATPDKTIKTLTTGAPTTATVATGSTAATVQAVELALVGLGFTDATSPPFSPTSGYQFIGNQMNGGANPAQLAAYWKALAATGVQSFTAGIDPASESIGELATFLAGSAASLPAGTYRYRVSALNASGQESVASPIQSVTLTATGATDLVWTAPATGTPTGYRVYWSRDGGSWRYLATGASANSYRHTTESGATIADPPASSASVQQWRLGVGLTSGQVTRHPAVDHTGQANVWGWQLLAKGVVLAPSARALDNSTRGWYLQLEHYIESGTANADADVVRYLPSESQASALYLARDLATPRTWELGQDAFGRPLGVLTDGTNVVGSVSVIGSFEAGPGDAETVFVAEMAGGVSDLANLSLSAVRRITPRYRGLPGTS